MCRIAPNCAWMHASTHAEAPEPGAQARTHWIPFSQVASASHAAICDGLSRAVHMHSDAASQGIGCSAAAYQAFSRHCITGEGAGANAAEERRIRSICFFLDAVVQFLV